DYELNQDVKAWRILVKSDQLNTPIFASISDNFNRNSEKLYLREVSNSTYTNIAANPAQFTIPNANYKEFYLYWGNLNPTVTIGSSQNTIYQAGANATFYFSKTLNFLIQNHSVYIKNDSDSVLVAENLSNTATNAGFTVPNNITMHNARVYVKTVCTDGEIIISQSPYTIGIVPSTITYQVPAGYSMQSNPFIAYNINNNDLGPNSQISLFENNAFSNQNQMIYNKGYALNIQNSVNTSFSQGISSYAQTQSMVPYWNLLGNPHLSSYHIKDLQFNLNNVAYSFGELVQQSVIAPVVYVYRNNQYQTTEVIYPNESFFIYASYTSENTMSCNFVPYYQNGLPIDKNDILWSSKIFVSQLDRDEIVFGVCKSKNNEIEFLSELPEPPTKAINDNISMYIPVDENLNDYSYSKLNQYLHTEFNETDPEVKEWPLGILLNDLSPVTISTDFQGLPTGYSVRIALDNQEHTLTENNPSFTFTPQSIGTINANLLIGNQYVANHDQIAKPFSVSVYPNPFNPVTNIAFNLPVSGNVEISIFNIKGQKVNSLVNEKLRAGSHIFQWTGKDSNGKNCASNIYFALVKVNGKQQVIKKITLLK
ncbi:MAG TPA: T9SS type A sorting domain-containing protein, partial [Candidatus Cloacimonadota bacterium]|nr:T9SS type A sorting domain-containing protein [Candidatus Cloacimonadota bacterium]